MSQYPSPQSFALREEIDRTLLQRSDFDSWSPRLQAALTEQQTESEFALLRFQMLVWASISGFTLVWDLFAVPEASEVAILWRLLTSLPLAIIGLLVLRKGQSLAMKVVIAATLISLGIHFEACLFVFLVLGLTARLVFETRPSEIWPMALRELGGIYRLLAEIPLDASLN